MSTEQERAEREAFMRWATADGCFVYIPGHHDPSQDLTTQAWLAACAHKDAEYVTKIATYEARIKALEFEISKFIGAKDDRLAGGV